MYLSVATANLFFRPFEQALDIIAEAGFQQVELDLYWERKAWAMAQHLQAVSPRQAVQWVHGRGLRITSIHDGGGVLDGAQTTDGFINPSLDEYLDAMGYAPECLVFHTPHIEGHPGAGWWERISGTIAAALAPYRRAGAWVTIENTPPFDGYTVPLTTPEALLAFVAAHDLHITLDTTHYAQMGADVVSAARVLAPHVKTVHLSDFSAGRTHVFIGEGELDLAGCLAALHPGGLNAITLECSLAYGDQPAREMGYRELVTRMREARLRLEGLL